MAINLGNGKIDATDPNNLNGKVLSERETRKKLLTHARRNGFEREYLILLNKYDTLLRNCSNEQEREDIGKLGALEIYKLFGKGGEFYVNNQLIFADKG